MQFFDDVNAVDTMSCTCDYDCSETPSCVSCDNG